MKHWQDRQGVWIESDQGVGIRLIEKIRLGDQSIDAPYIHIVDSSGGTMAQVPESALSNVRIARRASIPPDRIAHLNSEQLGRLGYV